MASERFSRSFKAQDSTGNEYTINEFVEYMDPVRLLDGTIEKGPTGRKSLRTPNGQKVSPIQRTPNQLQVFSGGKQIIVKTDDPQYLSEFNP